MGEGTPHGDSGTAASPSEGGGGGTQMGHPTKQDVPANYWAGLRGNAGLAAERRISPPSSASVQGRRRPGPQEPGEVGQAHPERNRPERGGQAEPERDTDRVGQGGARLGQLQAREPARLSSPLPALGHPSASSCSNCSRPSCPIHCHHQRRRHLTLASGRHHRRLRSLRLRLRRHAFRPRLRRAAQSTEGRAAARALGSNPPQRTARGGATAD